MSCDSTLNLYSPQFIKTTKYEWHIFSHELGDNGRKMKILVIIGLRRLYWTKVDFANFKKDKISAVTLNNKNLGSILSDKCKYDIESNDSANSKNLFSDFFSK